MPTVTDAEISMSLHPFVEKFGDDEDKALANQLLHLTREVRILLGQYFLYTAMSRSNEFGTACNASEAREGRGIILGSLLRSMVISTAALFDSDPRTCNIPRILKTALTSKRSTFLGQFHVHHGVEAESQVSMGLLVNYRRKLKRGKLREAIRALIDVRNSFLAHFDMQPDLTGRRAIIRDLDHVISAASIVVGEANVYVLGRRVDTEELRKLLRKDARGFVATLRRGFT